MRGRSLPAHPSTIWHQRTVGRIRTRPYRAASYWWQPFSGNKWLHYDLLIQAGGKWAIQICENWEEQLVRYQWYQQTEVLETSDFTKENIASMNISIVLLHHLVVMSCKHRKSGTATSKRWHRTKRNVYENKGTLHLFITLNKDKKLLPIKVAGPPWTPQVDALHCPLVRIQWLDRYIEVGIWKLYLFIRYY